jgi:hypothetical protein
MNLAPPGTQYGPCVGECPHQRCERSRRTASMTCRFCGAEIGYCVNYVADPARRAGVVHCACIQKEN